MALIHIKDAACSDRGRWGRWCEGRCRGRCDSRGRGQTARQEGKKDGVKKNIRYVEVANYAHASPLSLTRRRKRENKGDEVTRATARVPSPHPLHPRPYNDYGSMATRATQGPPPLQ